MVHTEKKTRAMDMTSGSIAKLLIFFAVPLMVGNLFQLLYNTVDSLVVGNFVGREALAAVGSTTSVINTLVMFFNGTSVGAGVVISRYFGAKNDYRLHQAVETTIALTLLCGVILTGIGIKVTPFLLKFMDTPDDVLPSASVYLRIYFSGVSGLLMYNMGSAILRAVGDTKRPLLFLCFSSIMNMILDLIFVLVFHQGIAGVAYATIISQFLSAILILVVLTRSTENYRFVWKDLQVEKDILNQILVIGLPAGLQQSITSFSNVYVQSYINGFGSACMAGWSCYTKIDQLIMLPLQSMSQAATTFVGQNIGAGNLKRAKKGTNTALGIASLITFASASVLWLSASYLVRLFNQETEVVFYGVLFLRLCVFFTVFCCPNQIVSGSLRGVGDSKTPMFILLFSFVLFRQIYLYTITQITDSVYAVGLGYPVGWIVCSLLVEAYYLSGKWEKRVMMD